jgi:hypothetical protein
MPVKKHKAIPEGSIIGKSFGVFDYFDAYSISLTFPVTSSIDILFSEFGNISPLWIKALVKLRNFLVGFLGLKTGETEKLTAKKYERGDKIGFFKIQGRNEQEIVFGEDDKHLNFASSLHLKRDGEIELLYFITIVKFHNFTGRAYFFFIKPFHKLIIRSVLKHLAWENE